MLSSASIWANVSRIRRGVTPESLAMLSPMSTMATDGSQATPATPPSTALDATAPIIEPTPPTSVDPAKAQLPSASATIATSTHSTTVGALLRLGTCTFTTMGWPVSVVARAWTVSTALLAG